MWRFTPLLLACTTAAAGEHDFYRCETRSGEISYSVTPCTESGKQRIIQSDALPVIDNSRANRGGMVRLIAQRHNQFYATVFINGHPARAMIDTGASFVTISPSLAQRINLDTQHARRGLLSTANGVAPTLHLTVNSVELAGNTYRNIAANILSKDMVKNHEVLLGMSFLRNFVISTDGHVMTLNPK